MGEAGAKRHEGPLRRALHRLSTDTAVLDAEELQKRRSPAARSRSPSVPTVSGSRSRACCAR